MFVRSTVAAIVGIPLLWLSGASSASAPTRSATFYLAEAGVCSHHWRLTTSKADTSACPTTVVDGQTASSIGVTEQVYAAKAGDLHRLRLSPRRKLSLTFAARAIAPARLPISDGPTGQPDYVDTAGLADATLTVKVNGESVLTEHVLEVLELGVIRTQTLEAALPSKLSRAGVRSLTVTVTWANAVDATVWTDGAWRSSLTLPVT